MRFELCLVGGCALKWNIASLVVSRSRHIRRLSLLGAKLRIIGGSSLELSPVGGIGMGAGTMRIHCNLIFLIILLVLGFVIELACPWSVLVISATKRTVSLNLMGNIVQIISSLQIIFVIVPFLVMVSAGPVLVGGINSIWLIIPMVGSFSFKRPVRSGWAVVLTTSAYLADTFLIELAGFGESTPVSIGSVHE